MTADNFFIHAKKTFRDEISSINHSLNNLSKKDLDKVNNEISIIVDQLFVNAENEIDSNSEDLMSNIY